VQLRASDGINFTRAGQRKLAYFVEQELNAILGVATPLVATANPATVVPGETGPKIGPMIPIEALTSGGTMLSAAASAAPPTMPAITTVPQPGAVVTDILERLGGDAAAAPPAGRIDDYVWPIRTARTGAAPAPPAAGAAIR
jgi:hypothetical protein